MHRIFWIGLIYCLKVTIGSAQLDSHYWTLQYGAKGILLNGAVIASSEEENAIYYNPAALGSGHSFGVSLSFIAPTLSRSVFRNFLAEDTKVSDNTLDLSPGFAAVGFALSKDRKWMGGAATFTRYRGDVEYNERQVGAYELNQDQLNIGSLEYLKQLNERWFGFGISYRHSPKISFGMSQYITFHSALTTVNLQRDIIDRDNTDILAVTHRFSERYRINNRGGFVTKFGLSWRASDGKIAIGATLTTPSYGFLIRGGAYSYSFSGHSDTGDTFAQSFALDQIKPNYKTPLSMALGLEYRYKAWEFYSSAEYFSKLYEHDIFRETIDPFAGQSNSNPILDVALRSSSRSVLNVAVGISARLSDQWRLLLGGRSDHNPERVIRGWQNFESISSIPSVNHFSIGGMRNKRGKQLSFGLNVGFGNAQSVQNVFDIAELRPSDIVFSKREVESSIQSIMLVFTYDFIFDSMKQDDQ